MDLIEKNNEITEAEVSQYLKKHTGFLFKRDDLLLELQLAHPSGQATSLLERQVFLLRERNINMRSRLSNLLDDARDNSLLFDKTKQLVLSLIESKELDSIVNTCNRSFLSDFSVDFSSLILFGNPLQHRKVSSKMVLVDHAFLQIPALLKDNEAICGVFSIEELQFLFAEQADLVGSAAVVPLNCSFPLGVLAIGSKDPNHFRSGMETVFLRYIAEVLNRILPNHLEST